MLIRDETEADHAAVGRLHRLAFAGDAEARLVDALRRSGAAAVSLGAGWAALFGTSCSAPRRPAARARPRAPGGAAGP